MATNPSDAGARYEGISLSNLLQNCFSCGLITVDSQGRISELTTFLKTQAETSGGRGKSRAGPSLPPSLLALVKEVQKTGRWIADRKITLASNGEPARTISATAIPLPSAAKTPNVVLLLKDAASIRTLELQIHRLNRLASVGTLSASMAHEIKNALVPVKTFVGLILEKTPEAELAGAVRREVDRIDAIVSRVLKFAAPSKPSLGPVRLHELIEHSLHLVQHRVSHKQIAFTRHFKAASDACSGDDHQLEQAFVNLLLNGVEAMGTQGVLTVSTDLVTRDPQLQSRAGRSSPFLRVEIADTGVGIAPEKMNSIFEPFFTTKSQGTGLGLAVTRRIIEDHSGFIHVKSLPGKGTAFTVFLPAAAPGNAPA